MDWKGYRNTIAVLLFLSVIVSFLILAYDGLLWFDNPKNGHAYVLIAFTIADIMLIGLLLVRPTAGVRATLLWSTLQFIMMVLNPLSGPIIGISPQDFALYLLGLTPTGSAANYTCTFECPPFRYSNVVLTVLQVVLIVGAYQGRKQLTEAKT